MSDQIRLQGLEFYGFHGVLRGERDVGQRFLVDVALQCDISTAARTDDLTTTINYAEVADMVASVVTGPARDLIETVVADIADRLILCEGVDSAEVTIHKPSAPIAHTFKDVSITTTRRRDDLYYAVLSIGANMGEARETVADAIDSYASDPAYQLVAASPIYRTPAWGGVEQSDFANATIMVATARRPLHILRDGQARENEAGRRRTVRWGPRTLDVDIVDCTQGTGPTARAITSSTEELQIPHPWASQRAFVLLPWLDIDPDAQLSGESVAKLLQKCDHSDRTSMKLWDDAAVPEDAAADPRQNSSQSPPREVE